MAEIILSAPSLGEQVHSEEEPIVRHVVDPKVVQAAEAVLRQVQREVRGDVEGTTQAADVAEEKAGPMDGGTLSWLLRQFGLARHTARLEGAELDMEKLLRVRRLSFCHSQSA
jgi:hypothetical protein